MKIEKQTATLAIDAWQRNSAQTITASARGNKPLTAPTVTQTPGKTAWRDNSGQLQLNQQLSLLQASEDYLAELGQKVAGLKVLTGELAASGASQARREALAEGIKDFNGLLSERETRTGHSLDAQLNWHHSTPARTTFTLKGLESLAQVRAAGGETLVVSAGSSAEPMVVLLDDNMSDSAILSRLNNALAGMGMQAEADQRGQLSFSLPETTWQQVKGKFKVTGEGRLFPVNTQPPMPVLEQGLKPIEPALAQARPAELRQLLDTLVQTEGGIAQLREELGDSLDEIRLNISADAESTESQWAEDFVRQIFSSDDKDIKSYAKVVQAITGQAQLARNTVLNLLGS